MSGADLIFFNLKKGICLQSIPPELARNAASATVLTYDVAYRIRRSYSLEGDYRIYIRTPDTESAFRVGSSSS